MNNEYRLRRMVKRSPAAEDEETIKRSPAAEVDAFGEAVACGEDEETINRSPAAELTPPAKR